MTGFGWHFTIAVIRNRGPVLPAAAAALPMSMSPSSSVMMPAFVTASQMTHDQVVPGAQIAIAHPPQMQMMQQMQVRSVITVFSGC